MTTIVTFKRSVEKNNELNIICEHIRILENVNIPYDELDAHINYIKNGKIIEISYNLNLLNNLNTIYENESIYNTNLSKLINYFVDNLNSINFYKLTEYKNYDLYQIDILYLILEYLNKGSSSLFYNMFKDKNDSQYILIIHDMDFSFIKYLFTLININLSKGEPKQKKKNIDLQKLGESILIIIEKLNKQKIKHDLINSNITDINKTKPYFTKESIKEHDEYLQLKNKYYLEGKNKIDLLQDINEYVYKNEEKYEYIPESRIILSGKEVITKDYNSYVKKILNKKDIFDIFTKTIINKYIKEIHNNLNLYRLQNLNKKLIKNLNNFNNLENKYKTIQKRMEGFFSDKVLINITSHCKIYGSDKKIYVHEKDILKFIEKNTKIKEKYVSRSKIHSTRKIILNLILEIFKANENIKNIEIFLYFWIIIDIIILLKLKNSTYKIKQNSLLKTYNTREIKVLKIQKDSKLLEKNNNIINCWIQKISNTYVINSNEKDGNNLKTTTSSSANCKNIVSNSLKYRSTINRTLHDKKNINQKRSFSTSNITSNLVKDRKLDGNYKNIINENTMSIDPKFKEEIELEIRSTKNKKIKETNNRNILFNKIKQTLDNNPINDNIQILIEKIVHEHNVDLLNIKENTI
jgi:hypothetical protein